MSTFSVRHARPSMDARPFETEIANFIAALTALGVLNLFTPIFSKLGGRLSSLPPEVVVAGLKGDPFNAAKVEDFVDGTPTFSEGSFWQKVHYFHNSNIHSSMLKIPCLPSYTGGNCCYFSCKEQPSSIGATTYGHLVAICYAIFHCSSRLYLLCSCRFVFWLS